jgi:XapX domain-containing protein
MGTRRARFGSGIQGFATRARIMKLYLVSLGAGVVVGVVYSLMNVRSPAPPLVALVGLLGILLGEQLIPVSRHLFAGASIPEACQAARCTSHLFGLLPGRHQEESTALRQAVESTP